MKSWVRLLASALVLVAVLAGGTNGAVSAAGEHSCVEMSMDDCPDHAPNSIATQGCQEFVCAPGQGAIPHHGASISSVIWSVAPPAALLDDYEPRGLSVPPGLRPPIA
jgi:hypothetical protein